MTKRKIAFLFSGQGSQYFQMGRDLYEQNLTFRTWMERMDRLAQQRLGTSVVAALYGANGKAEPFDAIRLTHPAIFMVEFALAKTLIELGIEPDCTLGASLGTFAALAIAGNWSMEDALTSVLQQALLIESDCPKGGMIAVLDKPKLYEDSPFLQARSLIAGRNFAAHFVLALPEHNLPAVERFLSRAGVVHQAVPVQYPFHTPWIEPMRDRLIEASGIGRLRLSGMPMYCCANGGVLTEISAAYLWQVARKEIAFMRTIAAMEASGPFDYVDLSPSGTLSTFLKYLLPKEMSFRVLNVMAPFGRDSERIASVLALLQPNSRLVSTAVEG